MKKRNYLYLLAILLFFLPIGMSVQAETVDSPIYDYAGLLTTDEVAQLKLQSSKLSEESETAFIIITADGTDGKDIVQYVQDFYDNHASEFGQFHGNAAILAIDMMERDIYLAGFKKAEDYLTDSRLDVIRNEITPDLSEGRYFAAFSGFINQAVHYMETEETAVIPPAEEQQNESGQTSSSEYENESAYEQTSETKNLIFEWWFQLIVSVALGGAVVGTMMLGSGGKVTVSSQTYNNQKTSAVLDKYDRFVRKTVTKQKKPSSNNKSSGGGGFTSGGHSHSGSRGKF